MPDLPLQHVIFTRVERAYSPRNTSGYQVVYQSPALGREVAQIEQHLQCFEVDRHINERLQFFWTDQAQAIIAKTVPLRQPDPELIDASQRDAFLAHALVMGQDAFAAARNDPFAVFEAASKACLFAEDEEQLRAFLDKPPAERLAIPFRNPGEAAYLLDTWLPEALECLFSLGMRASAMCQQGQSLMLLSEDENEIYNLLFLLLMLIPPPDRGFCTFDTFVNGCYPSAGSVWAMGGSKDRPHPGLLPIYLQEQGLAFQEGGAGGGFPDPKVLMRTAFLCAASTGCAEANREGIYLWAACYVL